MAITFVLPKGMRWPRKAPQGSAGQGRAKAWYEIRCPCGTLKRTALGQKTNICSKCKVPIPGPWD